MAQTPSYSRVRRAASDDAAAPFDFPQFAALQPRAPVVRAGGAPGSRSSEALARAIDEAYARGHADGSNQARGEQEARERAAGAALAQRMDTLLSAMTREFEAFERLAAERLTRLALSIAERVVATHVATRPDAVVPVIREALAAVAQSRADMTIVLNPQDAENAQSELARILAAHALRLSTDASITRGSARLESPAGNVDATLETRWQRVREAIGMPASQVDDRANDEARR